MFYQSSIFDPDPWADPSNPYGVKALGRELEKIEEDFWTSTPVLEFIAAKAHEDGVGRWALLATLQAFVLSWVPSYVVLSSRTDRTSSVVKAGSLNFFTHLLGTSNSGKGDVVGTAWEILPPNITGFLPPGQPEVGRANTGTGEGLLKKIVKRKRDENKEWIYEQQVGAVVQIVHEMSTFVAEHFREGTKAPGIFASLWVGESVGNDLGSEENATFVPMHGVRVCAVRSGQPRVAAKLFTPDLIDDGTVQRPLWTHANEPWCPSPVTHAPGANPIHRPGGFAAMLPGGVSAAGPVEEFYPRAADTPQSVVWVRQTPQEAADLSAYKAGRDALALPPDEELALSDDAADARQGYNIMGHSLFMRRKASVAMALLHGHLQPTDQDWMLSGVQMRVYRGDLAWLALAGKKAAERDAREAGKTRGQMLYAQSGELEAREVAVRKEIVDTAVQKLWAAGGPRRISYLYHGSDAKKKLIRSALADEVLRDDRRLVEEGGVFYPADRAGEPVRQWTYTPPK